MSSELFTRFNFEIRRLMFEYSPPIFPSLWNDIRLHEIEKILSHAAKNTEYWNNVLRATAMDPKNLTDLARFNRIPPLTRTLMKEQERDTFVARGIPKNRRLLAHTSGSTGEPFMFYQDTKELLNRRLNIIYGLRLHGMQLRRPALISGLDTHAYLEPLGSKFSDLRNEKSRTLILYPLLEGLKPEVLFCTPSYLKMFYGCLKQDGKKFSFKMIYCAGESMSKEDKKIFSSIFSSKVSTWYGTREIGPIGVECAAGEYHLLPWSNYLEIVNSNGIPLRMGEEGDIVVTSFSNYVMPFIRYKTGDRGAILPNKCVCDSSIPVLQFVGREPVIIKTPGGNSFTVSELGTAVASQFAAEILQFQLTEKKAGEYTFRFVPSDRYTPELNTPILKTLYEIAGKESNIKLEKTQKILPDESGKTPIFLKN